jgi:hypothetical protein
MTDDAKDHRHHLPGIDILIGIMRVGLGRADGLALFGDSVGHFTASLAPFVALPLVGTALALVEHPDIGVIGDLLATWCGLLAPAVLTWELARKWGREPLWLRYATAFNWCMWDIPIMAFMLLIAVAVLIGLGLPNNAAALLLPIGLGAYALWLHWFIARHGLRLTRFRAALVVILVNLVTSALVLAPVLLAGLTS